MGESSSPWYHTVFPVLFFAVLAGSVFIMLRSQPGGKVTSGEPAPRPVLVEFMTAVSSGDLATAYDLTSPELQAEQSFDAFRTAIEKHTFLLGRAEVTSAQVSGSGETRLLRGTVIVKDGPTGFEAQLRLDSQGAWRISGLKVDSREIMVSPE